MRDMATGRPRGFAFVEMATDAAAEAAVNQFNQKEFGGRTLAVNEARPMAPRSGGFGGGGGGRREGGRREGGGRRSEPRW
jgi:RNA recognition motif-containing protein